MGRFKRSEVVGERALHVRPTDERIVPESKDALQIVAKNAAGKKAFELDDKLVHRNRAVLVFIDNDPRIGIKDTLPDKLLLKQVRHGGIDVIPFGDVSRTAVSGIVGVLSDPAPGPAGNGVNVVLGSRNVTLSEALPEGVDAGVRMGEDKLRVSAKFADRADDGLGLAAAGRRFDVSR